MIFRAAPIKRGNDMEDTGRDFHRGTRAETGVVYDKPYLSYQYNYATEIENMVFTDLGTQSGMLVVNPKAAKPRSAPPASLRFFATLRFKTPSSLRVLRALSD
jgi:hypothetical protein